MKFLRLIVYSNEHEENAETFIDFRAHIWIFFTEFRNIIIICIRFVRKKNAKTVAEATTTTLGNHNIHAHKF